MAVLREESMNLMTSSIDWELGINSEFDLTFSFRTAGLCVLADRALQKQGTNAATGASSTAGSYGTQAGTIAGTLVPQLTRMATNPAGLNPTDLNQLSVANQQAAGGAAASNANQAQLRATRSNNVGSLSSVLDSNARNKMATLADAANKTQVYNSNLKNEQQQSALKGLQGIYGTDVGAQIGSQGQVANDINAATNAGKSGWLQNTLGTISTITGGAKDVMGGLYGTSGMMNS